MKFKKEDLLFLELYCVCSDTKNVLHDKLIIKTNKEKNQVIFAQISADASLHTVLNKNDIEKDFTIIYDVNSFYSIIKLTPNSEEIFMDDEKIKFGRNSTYDFKKYNFDSSIIDSFNNLDNVIEKVIIKDLSKIGLLKSFIGLDSFGMVNLYNGWFVAHNAKDITGAIETENDNKNDFVLPKVLTNLISLMKLNEVEFEKIKINNNYLKIKINNTQILFPEKESKIQNIFEDEIRKLYYHPTKAVVKKNDLILALQRISITTSKNIFNRINLICEQDNLKLLNNEVGHAEENILAKIDQDLIGVRFSLSSTYLRMITNLIEGEDITILISKDIDALAVTLEGENKNRFYVHNLYEIIDN